MSKAPSEVDNAQLEELGIAVIEDEQFAGSFSILSISLSLGRVNG